MGVAQLGELCRPGAQVSLLRRVDLERLKLRAAHQAKDWSCAIVPQSLLCLRADEAGAELVRNRSDKQAADLAVEEQDHCDVMGSLYWESVGHSNPRLSAPSKASSANWNCRGSSPVTWHLGYRWRIFDASQQAVAAPSCNDRNVSDVLP